MRLCHHNYYIFSIFHYIVFYRYLFPFLSSDYRHKILLDEVGIIRDISFLFTPDFACVHQFGNAYDFCREQSFLYNVDFIIITSTTQIRTADIDSKPQLMIFENHRRICSQSYCHILHRIMFVY